MEILLAKPERIRSLLAHVENVKLSRKVVETKANAIKTVVNKIAQLKILVEVTKFVVNLENV